MAVKDVIMTKSGRLYLNSNVNKHVTLLKTAHTLNKVSYHLEKTAEHLTRAPHQSNVSKLLLSS